jgi:hypothetical protein
MEIRYCLKLNLDEVEQKLKIIAWDFHEQYRNIIYFGNVENLVLAVVVHGSYIATQSEF